MDILAALRSDYRTFPQQQSFDLYAPDVFFKDPLTQFRGITRYQQMIGFIGRWVKDVELQLHHIDQLDDTIHTRWTLNWTTPLPWQARIAIPGRSELVLNQANLISSHIDFWDCSPWNVVKQHFTSRQSV